MTNLTSRNLLRSSAKEIGKHVLQLASFLAVIVVLLCLNGLKHASKETRQNTAEENQRLYFSRYLLSKENDASDNRCVDLHNLNSSERCEFVKKTDDCLSQDGFLQYIRFPYCTLPSAQPLAYVVLVFWLIFLFILVGITADDYFCPALTVISDSLKLSPNIAGVTFLAYGNGAPDIFSAVAGFVNNKSTGSLALSALIGAGMFVTTIVVGVVSLSVSYDLNQRPYTRDVLFYLGALGWTIIIVYRKKIDLLQAIGFIVLYVVYVVVVIVGRVVYQRYKRRLREQGAIQDDPPSSDDDDSEFVIPGMCQGNIGPDETTPLLVQFKPTKTHHLRTVLRGLFPFSRGDFFDSGLLTKVYCVIKVPMWPLDILFCLTPDDFTRQWGGPLLLKGGLILLGGKFPLAALVVILGLALAIAVAVTSRQAEPPWYHKLFAFMSFVASVIWIYSTANEIVNLLRMFGIVFKLSNEILGLTLLAWGNSIADFISNLAVAKQGFPQMAIAACFGGPLLNLLLGVGLSCTIAASREHDVLHLETSLQDYISTIFLAVSLSSSAIIVPLLGFRIPKWYGIYLILLYISFLIVSILNETKVF